MEVFCAHCSDPVLSRGYACSKCSNLVTCSKLCYEKAMRIHKKECPGYLKEKMTFHPPAPAAVPSKSSTKQTLSLVANNSSGQQTHRKSSGQQTHQKSSGQQTHNKFSGQQTPHKFSGKQTPLKFSGQQTNHEFSGQQTNHKFSGQQTTNKSSGLQTSHKLSVEEAHNKSSVQPTQAGGHSKSLSQQPDNYEQVADQPRAHNPTTLVVDETELASSENDDNIQPEKDLQTEQRKRDKDNGRYVKTTGLQVNKVKTDTQKKKDQSHSKVTKWKKTVKTCLGKIQKEMSEVSILLTIDANKYKGSKNHIVYKTQGRPPMNPQPDETAESPSVSSLGNVSAQIGPFSGPTLDAPSQKHAQRERLSDCICYVCKLRLGSDHSKRIVCTKKDCFRAPAHFDCLNLDIPKAMVSKIRCMYRCPYHRGKDEQAALVSDDSDSDSPMQAEETLNNNASAQRARKRNDNILRPMRLSSKLMGVLGTPQQYLKANDIRSLMGQYIKKLMVVNKMYVPDRLLAGVLGDEPFKMVSVFKLLKLNKHISGS